MPAVCARQLSAAAYARYRLPHSLGGCSSHKAPWTRAAGTIARTCAATGVGLHLVGPLGYELDDRKLKRAGLDYWDYVAVRVHTDWAVRHLAYLVPVSTTRQQSTRPDLSQDCLSVHELRAAMKGHDATAARLAKAARRRVLGARGIMRA